MNFVLRNQFKSLSVRLFCWLFAVMVVVISAYASITIRAISKNWQTMLHQSANRTSEMIKSATYYGMLLNRKDDVHRTIRMIAQGPEVAGIRVYDKQGAIIFSSDASEIGNRVNLQAEACVICHDADQPLTSVPTGIRVRVYRDPEGQGILGFMNPIRNEPECSTAACHAHSPDQTVLGVLDVKLSLAAADESLVQARKQIVVAALLMGVLMAVTTAVFIYRQVRVPVRVLIDGTQRVARGQLDTNIVVGQKDEIGELAHAFNQMTEALRKANELSKRSRKLEETVVKKTAELTRAQQQIVHMEKMASLGKLAATVAHELNNPLAGILNYAKLVARDVKPGTLDAELCDELTRYLTLIQKESRRCGDIVRNMLVFARHAGTDFATHHLNQIVKRVLMLVRHHLEMSGIKTEVRLLDGDDTILCDGDQLQQALIALVMNGVESMPGGGNLSLSCTGGDDELMLEVTDTGTGIPSETLPHIFEPFFSTKEGTSGVGLGLAVVYGIVQRHGGTIDVESDARQGTKFRMALPRRPEKNESVDTESQPRVL